MALLDDIAAAKRLAVERVIAGGMRDDLHMAQVIAAENVVIASLEETRRLMFKKTEPSEPGKDPTQPVAEPRQAPPTPD